MRFILLGAIGLLIGTAVRAQGPADTAAPPVPASVRALAGCYRLGVVSPWRRGAARDTGAHWRVPERVRLDTVALERFGRTRFAVEPAKLVDYAHLPASWVTAGDSVAVAWSTGFTGVTLRLAARGDTLVGRAREFHDAHYRGEPPDPEAEVRAVRTRCGRELPPA